MSELQDKLQRHFGSTYAIERELGGGGMSRVFLADETALNRRVVIKVLPPEMGAGVNKERFELETQLAASLQHPLIVPILTAGSAAPTDPDLLYYVMPFIDGQALRERIDTQGELPVTEGVRIVSEVADALARAHDAGVVHRDIKPDNVMLSGKHAMVTDFGIAKAVSGDPQEGAAGLTQMGMSLGTPMYMSPEQAAGDPNVDHRADIYSLGVMAYELFTGRLPFAADTAQGLLAAHISEQPRPIRELRPAMPVALAETIMRCLEKKPADRWQSAEQLSGMLDAAGGASGAFTPASTQAINIDGFVSGQSTARVVSTFAIAGVLLLAVVYLLMIQLGLPDWTFQIAAVVTGVSVVLAGIAASRGGAGWSKMRRGLSGAYGLLVIGVIGYAGMRALGIGPVGSLVAAGIIEEQGKIVLAQFDNATSDESLGETVTELLRIDIAQSPAITLVDLPAVTATLQRMQRDPGSPLDTALASEVAVRLGAGAILAGEIRALGSDLVIAARIVETASGETVAAIRETARDGAVVDAIDRLSAALREKIGESLRTIRADAPLAEVTTGSTEALRLYAEADLQNNLSNPGPATRLLEEAIALDSNFAMAYRKLGIVLSNRNLDADKARASFTRAFELRDRLTERERFLADAAYYTYVADSAARALATYEALLDKYPTDRIGLNNLAVAYRAEGRNEDAIELYRRSIDQGGAPTVTYTNAMQVEYLLGQKDSARATFEKFKADYPGHLAHLQYSLGFAVAEFDYETAEAVLDSLTENPTGIPQIDIGMKFEHASLVGLRGRVGEMRELLVTGVREQAELGLGFVNESPEFYATIFDAYTTYFYQDDPVGAVAIMDRGLAEQDYYNLPYDQRDDFQVQQLLARAGRLDDARDRIRAIEAVEQPTSIDDRSSGLWAAYGFIALAEGRADDAVEAFAAAHQIATGCDLCWRTELGEALLEAGQNDSAVTVLEGYVDSNQLFRTQMDNFNLWSVRLQLAEAYRRVGRTEDAAGQLSDLLNQWSDADDLLAPLIEDIRNRLAELTGERQPA